MFKGNRNLYIIALIALVNMLGYGIIIPIQYAYSKAFGLSDFQNGLLIAVYSVCQFASTPIIGRLSDKYGRRPMLISSIVGTALSFFMLAFAPNAIFLFIARALDGLTAGNIPVAFAVISDTTKPEERPKAFGLVGAAFSFGFVFGPAIAALTVGFGRGVPFIIAGLITVIAALMTIFFLPETNKHMGEVQKGKLFDFGKLYHTLFDPNVGVTFIITLIFYLAFACSIIYGYQPYTKNILHISDTMNAVLFVIFGAVGLVTQTFVVQPVTKRLGMKHAFSSSIIMSALSFFIMSYSMTIGLFIFGSVILGIFNSIAQTLIPTILSQEADAKSQGSIMGLNASYQSIGMIFGPLLGGLAATVSIPLAFQVGGVLIAICFLLSFKVLRPGAKPVSEF